MFRIVPIFAALGLLGVSVSACGQGVSCQKDNEALQAMPKISVTLTRADGSNLVIDGKLADNNQTRSAGFQRVCASTIEAAPILFAFNRAVMPNFHMNNVVAPIDIAFIDADGAIESIQSMQPYSLVAIDKPLYGPKRPIVAALEAHPGFFSKHELGLDSKVSWSKPDSE